MVLWSFLSFFWWRLLTCRLLRGEIRLIMFLTVFRLFENNLRLLGEEPTISGFISITHIHVDPLFVMVDSVPAPPDHGTQTNEAIVYCLRVFSHGSVLGAVSILLGCPGLNIFVSGILRQWFKSVL